MAIDITKPPAPGRPWIVGHRGCAEAPENTLAALRRALALGVHGLEVDLRATAEGIPVLMHDATVDRTTSGHGPVASLTLAQLKGLDAGGEAVPTLAEALAEVKRLAGGRAFLMAEIKPPGMEEAAVRAIREAGAGDGIAVVVASFLPQVLERVRELAPELPCALVAREEPRAALGTPRNRRFRGDPALARAADLVAWATLGLWGVALEHPLIDEAIVAEARRRGLLLAAWTVDDPQEARRLRDLGVDAIITNRPAIIGAALGYTAAPGTSSARQA